MIWTLEMSLAVAAIAAVGVLSAGMARWSCRNVRRRFAEMARDLETRQSASEAAVESLRLAVQEVCRDVDGLETSSSSAQAHPASALNLSKRSQALRMHRHGAEPDQIAAGLGIPLQEVTLLLKVHEIVMANV